MEAQSDSMVHLLGNELNLQYRIPTEMTPRRLSKARKIFMERKNLWKKIVPGINRHQNVRKTYHYPKDNWKILAGWQVKAMPPAESSFQITEELQLSQAFWPLGLDNPYPDQKSKLSVTVLLMALVMAQVVLKNQTDQKKLPNP